MSDSVVQRMDFRFYHGSILSVCCLVLVLSLALEVRDDQKVSLRWGQARPLPGSCGMRSWLGIDCPACGLTRSFIHLAEGSLRASLQQHRLGWLIMLAVFVQIPYRIAVLKSGRETPWGRRFPLLLLWGLLILLVANWLMGLVLFD